MAQSIVTIHKLVGNGCAAFRRIYSTSGRTASYVYEQMSALRCGADLLFKVSWYDPTSIAVTQVVRDYLGRTVTSDMVVLCEDECVTVMAIVVKPEQNETLGVALDANETNIEELNILRYLVGSAFRFWSDLLVANHIESIVVISSRVLGPSLSDTDVSEAALRRIVNE